MHYFLSAKFIFLKIFLTQIRLFEDPESGWAFLHQRWIGHIKGSKSNRQDLHPLRMIISNYPTKIPKL